MKSPLPWRAVALAAGIAFLLSGLVPDPVAALAPAAQACPECADAVEGGQRGFFWAMIVMMAAPYLAVGLIGGGIFYAHRKSREEEVERWLEEE